MGIIDLKASRCKHCYKCIRNCEVKAIMIRDGRAEIMEDRCILCGTCLQICPQSAKTLVSDLERVRGFLADGDRVVVSMAPSYMGLLKFKEPGQVKAGPEKTGICGCAGDVRGGRSGDKRVCSSSGAGNHGEYYYHLLPKCQ